MSSNFLNILYIYYKIVLRFIHHFPYSVDIQRLKKDNCYNLSLINDVVYFPVIWRL